MKRADLVRHLGRHGCELLREGGRHSIYWNPANRKTSAVPRHAEIIEPVQKAVVSIYSSKTVKERIMVNPLFRQFGPHARRSSAFCRRSRAKKAGN